MPPAISDHPLVKRFWKQTGTRLSDNDSMSEDDWEYTIRLDEAMFDLREDRRHCNDGEIVSTRTLRGHWQVIKQEPAKVVLRLRIVVGAGDSPDLALVLTEKDINLGDLAWAMKNHV